MPVETNGRKIGRDDLQAAFAKAIGEGQDGVRASLPPILVVAAAVAVGLVAIAYVFGRRGGRNDSAILEIRRL
jgi:L-cystine uptake protein TcyP (sodium:dicarboxylate symporter family)